MPARACFVKYDKGTVENMNIGANTVIKGLKKTGCSVGHIQHCLHTKGKHDAPNYSYFGKRVSRGTQEIYTKNGAFTLKFKEENGWAKEVEVL